ncbi:minor tail protein [Mycobacterium phage Myxus]|uniref:Minor tail protein n=6 Tax=Fromanvirus packman TaxID=1034142 RepID=G1BR34_9CAUD|nr:minor tail protein [Mycobacterium phage Pioneer]YP_009301850.1 minor tail protein [Mycobacterium phage Catalina]YP_009635998.1 minor tail protein [Mycobacterium phage PackMan]AMO43896.1 minor tail protein [Mycobacterium phage Myxus]AOQ28985.1 minor tail protein [Mycobacterium phage HortumSL17]AOT26147.1 minor tail protein [Mycobacterium phage Qobbit]AOY12080.1 minor tail protein [Mycobacterium phage Phaeder]AVI04207.1 minor tail protein [Mycobacterium phage Phonnegut]AVI04421.1 minor tai
MITDTIVELEGVNGERFNLTTGDQGVYLATDVEGCFYDPPVKVVIEEPGNYPGARYLNHRILKRDIVFGVEILNDAKVGPRSWLSRDSEWRKAWAFNRDAKIYVTTPDSGTRYLKVRLFESPTVGMHTDPRGNSINLTKMSCIAYDPFWYEDDKVYEAKTKKDTTFDPALWPGGVWPWQELPQETLKIKVGRMQGGLNPTDQYIAPKWTVPGSQEQVPNFPWPFPPNIPIPWETAPFTQFVIPDYSFEDPEFENRRLKLPGLIYGENCVIDTDRREEQISSESGSQVWARMNGVRFRNMIPPYTEEREFEITASGCKPGQIITLRLPRPWTRCWGLE